MGLFRSKQGVKHSHPAKDLCCSRRAPTRGGGILEKSLYRSKVKDSTVIATLDDVAPMHIVEFHAFGVPRASSPETLLSHHYEARINYTLDRCPIASPESKSERSCRDSSNSTCLSESASSSCLSLQSTESISESLETSQQTLRNLSIKETIAQAVHENELDRLSMFQQDKRMTNPDEKCPNTPKISLPKVYHTQTAAETLPHLREQVELHAENYGNSEGTEESSESIGDAGVHNTSIENKPSQDIRIVSVDGHMQHLQDHYSKLHKEYHVLIHHRKTMMETLEKLMACNKLDRSTMASHQGRISKLEVLQQELADEIFELKSTVVDCQLELSSWK